MEVGKWLQLATVWFQIPYAMIWVEMRLETLVELCFS